MWRGRDTGCLRRSPVATFRIETDGLIGIADEHRGALGGGVQGDGGQVGAGHEAQLSHGVDEAHRRLTAVDHNDASQIPQIADVHRPRI